MERTRAGCLALALWGWAGFAHALGLGEIEIRSRLNQPISAQIPISAAAGEADDLIVELASNDEFERAGMERTEFLSSLRFEVQGDAIKVTSKQIAREPFVSFLVDVRWGGGRLLREYTVLLDPPAMAQAPAPRAPATAPATAPMTAPAASSSEPPSTAEAPLPEPPSTPPEAAPAAASYTGETYGPTAPKETLWSIAFKLRPDAKAITMDQMQVAIFNANPQAFDKGRLTGLMKGQTLRIPSADEIRAIDAAAAKAQVAAARGFGNAPATSAAAPPSTYVPPAEPAYVPPAETKPAPVEPAPVAPPPAQAEVTPPPAEVTAPPAEVAQAPAETPPPAEAIPETPAPTATAEPTPQPTPAEAAQPEPAPPATATPPPPEQPGMLAELVERGKALVAHEFFIPALAGIVVLLALIFGGRKIADKVAKWRYDRASRKPSLAPTAMASGASFGNEDVTQVAPEPSMQSALDEAGAYTPPMSATLTQTMAEQPMQATMQSTMQQTVQQTQVLEPPNARSGKVDFDVTGNFASETVQISLDAGDPVSEAEFHRAYGLYDEAALLLKQALQKDPKRTDAKVKLAEIYFEASKANEFVEVAQGLKGQVSDDEWQKIALLGSQIAPNNDLFKGGGLAAGGTVDLSFDEPAAPAAAPAAPAPAPAPAPAGDSLDFKLDDIDLPAAAPAAPAAPAAAPADSGLEFDLGSLSLDVPSPAEAPPAAGSPPVASAEPSLDLGSFDLDSPASGGGEVMEIGADSGLDVGGGGDESSTKLDLARAYIDMGDSDMAKSLLNEVSQQGNAEQQKEAQELLKRVTG